MTEEMKLITALHLVDNLSSLLKGNQYEDFIDSHLIAMQVELQRQLTNLKASGKL